MKLEELIEEALMTNKEVADKAQLSPGTVSRIINGHPTKRLSVLKILAVVGQKLGRRIDIDDIENLNLSD